MSDESKIVNMQGEPIVTMQTATTDVAVAEVLEDFLEKARAGEIVGVVLVAQHRDETVSGRTVGMQSYRSTGILAQMLHDQCAKRREDDE